MFGISLCSIFAHSQVNSRDDDDEGALHYAWDYKEKSANILISFKFF